MSTAHDPVLEIHNLCIAFEAGRTAPLVVNQISFNVQAGEVLGIVGESGSGKTLSALAAISLLPTGAKIPQGEILFRDRKEKTHSILEMGEEGLRRLRGREIGMIFQEPMSSLNPVMRCGKQLTEVLRLHLKMDARQARIRCLELFREVRLPRPESIYRAYPHQLSGGQKQRVMIAMAMACKPRLLIADEPTTALDVSVQNSILSLMQELGRKYGTSILFITHDLGVIRRIAHRVLVMHQGKIVEQGRVEEVFHHPVHPYTRGLMACRPSLGARPNRLLTIRDFLEETTPPAMEMENPMERQSRLKRLYHQEPLLKVQDMSTWFPDERSWIGKIKTVVKAVDEVSFVLYPGETLGLVGESGSGKTTLGRSLLRLQKSQQGRLFFEGQEITAAKPAEMRQWRKKMQIIFQDPYASLNPRMTAGEAIMEPMRVHRLYANEKNRQNKALEILERVGLQAEHFHRYPHAFSGGQRQRLGIARALALEPRFVVCDESVSALDVSVQAQVLNLLNELKAEFGLTYIFISHDLSVVRYMSDRIMVLKDGKLLEEGEADELIARPQQEYTRSLIASIPDIA